MEVKGVVKLVGDVETFGTDFTKRNLVVTTDEQYPQHIQIEFVKDKTSLLDDLKIGQEVTVNINLRGREWTNPEGVVKYFNSITGWRLTKEEGKTLEQAKEVIDNVIPEDDNVPF